MRKQTLSEKLKNYRWKENLTQQELAELLEVSDKSISKWELGEGYPSKRNLAKISEVLDVSSDALLDEQNQNGSDTNNRKQSIKYAVISYVLIFAVSMIVTTIRNDFSSILQQGTFEILKELVLQFIHYNQLAIPPACIIGLVFYFYIFPSKQEKVD